MGEEELNISPRSKFDFWIDWLNRRGHQKYDLNRRAIYILKIILIFFAAILAYAFFYSNGQKINNFNLGIFKLTGILLFISLFFIILYFNRIISEIFNFLKRQRNWIRCIIVVLFILLFWQIYENRVAISNSARDLYSETNFTLFTPIKFEEVGFLKKIVDPKSQINIFDLEQEVHRLVNIERTNNSLISLSWDDQIAQIARVHSQDMIARNFFDHNNPDGEDANARANRSGYFCRKAKGSYITEGLAENIAQTPIYSKVNNCGSTTDLRSLAKCIVDGWMNSSSHRKNILTSEYTKTGIGIAYSSDNKAYSTQNFC